MDYGEILSSAWQTVRKHKSILFFGVFSLLMPMLLSLLSTGWVMFIDNFTFLDRLSRGTISPWAGIIFFAANLLIVILSLLFAALGTAGTLKGALQAEAGQPVTFGGLWRGSWRYVPRILALMLLIGTGLMAIMSIPMALILLTAGVAVLCVLPFMLLIIPLGILVYLYMSLCQTIITADDLGVFAAMGRAWETLRAKFWPLVWMTVLLYLIQMVVGMVISLPASLIPAFAAPLLFLQGMNTDPFQYLRVTFGVMMPFVAVMYLAQGLVLAYINAAWMVAYLRLKGATPNPPPPPAPAPNAEPV